MTTPSTSSIRPTYPISGGDDGSKLRYLLCSILKSDNRNFVLGVIWISRTASFGTPLLHLGYGSSLEKTIYTSSVSREYLTRISFASGDGPSNRITSARVE